jgi:Tfp pilus assembly protein PilV
LHSSKTDRFQEEGLKWYGIERSRWRCGAQSAFSLIEVMIATTIFFVAMFSILGVLSTGLHAAAILRNNGPTAGMAVAALTLTNQLEEGSESGDFGEIYPNYTWGLNKREIATNGLFQVDVTVLHSGQFYSSMSILLYKKEATHR